MAPNRPGCLASRSTEAVISVRLDPTQPTTVDVEIRAESGSGARLIGLRYAELDGAVDEETAGGLWYDLAWQPLDLEPIASSVAKTGRLLVVQESGETQGLGDRLISLLTRECFHVLKEAPMIVASPDGPVPFAPELETAYRPSEERIRAAIASILGLERLRKAA